MYHELPRVIDLSKDHVEPVEILQRSLVKKGGPAVLQVLVRLYNLLPPDATTWEDYSVLRKAFPASLAWGQASLLGGVDVTAAPVAP